MKTRKVFHVAIIPDGNRRWAREKGLEETEGHVKSTQQPNISELILESKRLGITHLSLWGFSTENWKRNKFEVNKIFELIKKTLIDLRKSLHEEKIKFRHIGRKDRLPKSLIEEMDKLADETKNYSDFNLQFCLDYGGRDEIVRAVNKAISSGKKKINEEEFNELLDTPDIPDVDLIIRTSGEKRISGLMPFQAVYAELYFTDKYFPDFKKDDLRMAVEEFESRKRRFGGS